MNVFLKNTKTGMVFELDQKQSIEYLKNNKDLVEIVPQAKIENEPTMIEPKTEIVEKPKRNRKKVDA